MGSHDAEEPLRRLFGEAVERPPEVRPSFLDSSCGADVTLRGVVEELVRAHDRAVEILIDSDGDDAGAATGAAGERVGPYVLVRPIGEGGFGTVYQAEQRHPVRRTVALKVIKPGMDTRRVIARFEAERQALALMDHPHIARVLDAGSTGAGRPYFVMELVDGRPLTDYCDAERLDLPARLRLFRQVCLAVHHAHQKGVIHRDLKPTNILVTAVDGTPAPKVIDFGVARALHQRPAGGTLFTEGPQVIGTPEYMSPEQALGGGAVDTRADIYSLGVLLYELLTGATPFDAAALRAASHAEVQRLLLEAEPARPSDRAAALGARAAGVAGRRRAEPGRLPRLLRRELDWIVMRCLEKDPARRYDTAGDLAADVSRHLAGEPVSAGPPTARYRIGKFVARHKPLIAMLATAAATLLVGSALATYGMVRATRARADEQRERAVADAVSRVLQDMLSSVDPDLGGGREVLVREVLDGAARKLDDGSLREQPQVEAAVRGTLGRSYVALGDVARGEPELRKALELRLALLGPGHADVAESLYDLGTALQLKRDEGGARETYRQALDLMRRTSAPGASKLPLIHCLTNYGIVLGWHDDFAAAEDVLGEALGLSRAAGARAEAAKCVHCLAGVSARRGDVAAAIPRFREALALYRGALGDDHRQVGIAMGQLGTLLANSGQNEEAERLLREQIARGRRLLGDSHPHVIEPQRILALLLSRWGRGDEAKGILDAAITAEIDQLTRAVEKDPPDLVSLMRRSADYAELGRVPESRADFERLLSLAPPGRRASLLAERGRTLARLGHFREALDCCSASLEGDGGDEALWNLAACLSAYLGDTAAYRVRSAEMLRRFGDTPRADVAERVARTALLLPGTPDPAGVTRLLDRAAAPGTTADLVPWVRATKGIEAFRAGRFGAAVELLTSGRDGLDPDRVGHSIHAATATADFFLAMAHSELGHAPQARDALRRASERMDTRAPPPGPEYVRGGIEIWLVGQTVRREAERVVREPAAPPAR